MGKFKVGDVVEVIKDYQGDENCGHGSFIGRVFTIIGQAFMFNDGSGRGAHINILDEPSGVYGSVIGFEDEYLRLVPGDDCYEKTEWDESIYKPKELVRIEND